MSSSPMENGSLEAAGGVDEDLHSRQLAVYGREAMSRMARASVCIIGANGTAAEIAKDIILAGVSSVTLCDTQSVRIADLSSHFFLAESDVGANRAVASTSRLQELNPGVKVTAYCEAVTEAFLAQFQVVVVAEALQADMLKWNAFCHSHSPAIQFIAVQSRGVFGSIFVDFGPAFSVSDADGEQPGQNILADIGNDEKAVVVCIEDEAVAFDEGDIVTLSEVQGMEQLNGGQFKVVEVNRRQKMFKLDVDTRQMGRCTRAGIAVQVKQPKTFNFKSMADAIVSPPDEWVITDFSKMDRPPHLHIAFQALHQFQASSGRLPRPSNEDDAKALIQAANSVNATMPDGAKVEQVDEQLLRKLAYGASGDLSPMAAVLGGIVAQEVLKATSMKFTPIVQWLYFDAVETLPDPLPSEADAAPRGTRYDGQIAVFGNSLHEQMMNKKVFLVGAGALGCEFLKDYAMMGVACGPSGLLTVTDDDTIEKSNLSRQFLFRNWNIGKSKAQVASDAAKAINGAFNVNALIQRVSPATESVFNEDFWESQDCITNALDNVAARLFVDSKCLYFRRPLLESGTLGPKCNTQCIIPDLSENYGASRDPPEKAAPMCTIHSFPHNIDHCLVYARSEFEDHFDKTPTEVNNYLNNDNFEESVRKLMPAEAKELLTKIDSAVSGDTCVRSFEDCVAWARYRFEDYNNSIRQLVYAFPESAVTSAGTPFWSAPKRFPTAQAFNPNDELHQKFVGSAALLKASVHGIPQPNKDFLQIANVAAQVPVQPFVPKDGVKIETDPNAKNEKPMESDSDHDVVDQLLSKLSGAKPAFVAASCQMAPEEFEKDDDTNNHMEFIAALANLRARSYQIEEVDKLRAKLIAGRIIPAIATATAIASGLVCLEFYKLVQGKKLEDYRNTFISLAVSVFTASEPVPPAMTKHKDMKWSTWDRWVVEDGNITLQGLFDWLEAKGLEATMASIGSAMTYAPWVAAHKKRLPMRVVDIADEMKDAPFKGKKYVDLVIACADLETDESVDIPVVSVKRC